MNGRHFIIFLILIPLPAVGQDKFSQDFRKEAESLVRIILRHHLQPRPVDNSFSVFVYDHMLDELDPQRLYFTRQDLRTIEKYQILIDDELQGDGWSFLEDITSLYRKTLQRSGKHIDEAAQKSFSLEEKNVLWRKNERQWPVDDVYNGLEWGRWLKYKTLERLYLLRTARPAFNSGDRMPSYIDSLRQQVQKAETRNIQRILNHPSGFERYVATIFFGAIAAAFDPHTTYFSPGDMASFISSLSTEGYSFGLGLDENERGDVVISYVVPGGPAWNTGELHASDVLTYIKWNEGEVIDLHGLSADEISALFDNVSNQIIELTVRKAAGIQKTVRLRKEKMVLEENVVKSFLLKGDRTIGYISLAGFYSDWDEERKGNRCANDVAKEILKLSREKISGLILDLRYNGGGSLQEALEMAGIFIDQGTLGMVRDKTTQVINIKDNNRGTVYDGPLVLMVNRQSASASEFLAAALQDHNRAVIVGSQTFGKATAQTIFSLDPGRIELQDALSGNTGFGFVTVTIHKIYRVTGKTAQGSGIHPDILLPDVLDGIPDMQESFLPMALPADSVQKALYFSPLPAMPLTQLSEKSADRVHRNASFGLVMDFSTRLLARYAKEQQDISLSWSSFSDELDKEANSYKQIELFPEKNSDSYQVLNHASDMRRMQIDDFLTGMNEQWLRNLSNDVYLEEAFHIINDYIQIGKK